MQKNPTASWSSYLSTLEDALDRIKGRMKEATSAPSAGSDDWRRSVGELVDEVTDAIYALKLPAAADPEQSERVMRLKRNAQELYAQYLRAAGKTLPG